MRKLAQVLLCGFAVLFLVACEFSDGTKAGCIHIWSGVSCVVLIHQPPHAGRI